MKGVISGLWLIIKRIFLLFISIGLTSVYANTVVSYAKIDIDVKNITIKQLFEEIQSTSDYVFFYNDNIIKTNSKISLRLENVEVSAILDKAFTNTDLSYSIIEKQIIVKNNNQQTVQDSEIFDEVIAQEVEITGTIKDVSGELLVGVSVIIEGTSRGTESDFDGKYRITVPDGSVLIFSYLGMLNQKVVVGDKTEINVVMKEDAAALDEVLVVAYGTAKKSDFTGSASQINSDDLNKMTLSNVTTAIEGSSAGVTATFGSGQPGAGQNIRIRGFGSVSADSAPLYVVDGLPFTGDINSINPTDIESLTILKDASSTALYGNKAANGVVMITTKRGKNRKGQFSLNVSASVIDRSIPEYDRLGADQYYELMWEGLRNTQAIPGIDSPADVTAANLYATNNIFDQLTSNPYNVPNDQIVGVDGKINPNASLLYDDLNWVDAIARKGFRQNYDMSFQGGTKKSDFYASLGYLKEEGYILKSDFERISGRVNVNHQATSWLKAGVNIGVSTSNGNQAQATSGSSSSYVNPIRFTRQMGPIYPIYEHDNTGAYVLDANGDRIFDLAALRPSGASPGRHIMGEILWNEDLEEITSINGKSYFDITLTEGLVFTVNASFDQRNFYNTGYSNKLVGGGAPSGISRRTYNRRTAVGFNQLLNYTKTFNEKHNFKALLAHEYLDYKVNNLNGTRQGQITDNNTELINFVTTSVLSSVFDIRTDESYFGRINYDFDGRYFASMSYRQDGSSKFSADTRWGDFWSLGAAWRLDRESFIEDKEWINSLKLRASYGELGNNSGISFYAYQGLYDLGFNNQSEPGILQADLAAPKLLWEASRSSDVAVEFRLFDNRLDGVIEYYNRQSDNLLFDVPLPLTSGSSGIPENIGSMYNRGIEVSLNYDVLRTDDFTWNIGLNAATIKNQFTQLPQDEIIDGSKKLMVGHSIYDYWLRDWYGVDPADGEILYVAEEGSTGSSIRQIDGMTLTTDDALAKFHYAGTAIPDLTGSINNNFSYKNFNLSFLFTYQIGGEIFDTNYQGIMSSGIYGSSLSVDMLNRWQQPGDITNIPRMDPNNTTDFGADSDRWLTDASYLNLKRVNFSYDIPESLLNTIGVSNALVYVSGENLFSMNARKGMNLQQNFSGTVNNVYTPSRIVTLGLNVKF
ncbi:TonB-dependent receptor [Aureibaculum sp. A20]|uniref:TonB-dependent receptor n=1 Tax=Aureibaculum flavum TaxID=2795986 RepID=A0ABS0WNX3_9FLAO|nr:TonB-dependent receptor [Aureibaculum flavum]MBJ2173669.1 TonB-dependent receptor [Aureibaculum flavum]